MLSDRESDESMAPIPSLLSVSAVHHHLVRDRTRTQVGLVVEAGDAREVHHMACLVGFGAAAINPYMAFESIEDMVDRGVITGITSDKAKANYVKAAGKGVLKVMSKMGISTLASYTGAQLFQAIGISQQVLDEYFTGLTCPTGGIDLDDIADDVAARHALAYLDRPDEWAHRELEVGGEYQWRREGEYHLFNPDTVFKLQHSTRTGQYSIFKEYTAAGRRPERADGVAARPAEVQGRRAHAGAARRGRAGQRDRQAVLHRRDELRLDLRRGARDAGHRDEPPWRPVELG